MEDAPEDPPESDRFEEYGEIVVDGKPVFRIEQKSDISLSDTDDAAIALVLRELVEDVESSLREEHGMDLESILRNETPDVEMYRSTSDSWEQMNP
jgi:hypothetical protein